MRRAMRRGEKRGQEMEGGREPEGHTGRVRRDPLLDPPPPEPIWARVGCDALVGRKDQELWPNERVDRPD